MYFWLCGMFLALRTFSSCKEQRLVFLGYTGFLPWWLLLLGGTGSGCPGLSSCGDLGLSCSGACEIFPDQGFERTRVPCIGRRILILCATRKVEKVEKVTAV